MPDSANSDAVSSRFKRIAWDSFDFDEVISDLLRPSDFPFQHTLLTRALGAWVIAPSSDADRRDAILTGLRLAISKKEKKIFALPREEQFSAFEIMWKKRLGPPFFAEVYGPIGGASALNRWTDQKERKAKIRKDHHAAFRNLQKMVKLFHYAAFTELPKDTHPHQMSLERCYKIFKEFNEWSTSSKPYVAKSQMQNYIRDYGQTAIVAYAAKLTPVNETTSLFGIFSNYRSSIPDRVRVIEDWLGAISYLNEKVVDSIDSKILSSSKSLNSLKTHHRSLKTPALRDEEKEIVERVLHKSYRGLKKKPSEPPQLPAQ